MTTCTERNWQSTGEQRAHVDFTYQRSSGRYVFAMYVQCAACKQRGFRKPGGSSVVYIWTTP